MSAAPTIDVFCKVVDNYGDIGVCWRLARQLAARSDCGTVRLWVDDLPSFSRIAPGIVPGQAVQTLNDIAVVHWDQATITRPDLLDPADLVIEAFACEPPPEYVARLTPRQLWLNLEYLSAEAWVESCHGLPSPQPNGLRKFFFFPGFTSSTGGLLREPQLICQRNTWQADQRARLALLAQLGVNADWLRRIEAGARLVYVYCYSQAPLPALQQTLAGVGGDTLILIAKGIWPYPLPDLPAANGRVAVHAHEFVDQATFDRLLWSSDLNIVRGEDSLIRALWAGRPMVWQPYLQDNDAHLDKLEAWLARAPFASDIQAAMRAWNHGDADGFFLSMQDLLQPERYAKWLQMAGSWCAELTQAPDLATKLLSFYAENEQTR